MKYYRVSGGTGYCGCDFEEYVAALERQNKVLKETIFLMGKWMRKNPGADLDLYFAEDMLSCLAGGCNDPEGKAYIAHFLQLADKNLTERGEI